ncbi:MULTISPECIES: hypothetical protein [Pseudomonas]|uniref:hypothetical protein n=1 Tax=Pseudomonas TaxID=286 RepID=UPI0011B0C033|nr:MULTISPECIES: hypothetical protein [Pseudomonas]QXN48828.1 hypothetical protein KW062_21460 [Pseudomonas fluorescens]WSO23138.1 hypothetical protein VUJ50_21610 [Pseudomonas fluorescens]
MLVYQAGTVDFRYFSGSVVRECIALPDAPGRAILISFHDLNSRIIDIIQPDKRRHPNRYNRSLFGSREHGIQEISRPPCGKPDARLIVAEYLWVLVSAIQTDIRSSLIATTAKMIASKARVALLRSMFRMSKIFRSTVQIGSSLTCREKPQPN